MVSTPTGYWQNLDLVLSAMGSLEGAQLRNELTMFTRIVLAAQEVGGGVRRTGQDGGLH